MSVTNIDFVGVIELNVSVYVLHHDNVTSRVEGVYNWLASFVYNFTTSVIKSFAKSSANIVEFSFTPWIKPWYTP